MIGNHMGSNEPQDESNARQHDTRIYGSSYAIRNLDLELIRLARIRGMQERKPMGAIVNAALRQYLC